MTNKTQTQYKRAPVEGEKPLHLEGGITNMTSKYDYSRLWNESVAPKAESGFSEMRDMVRAWSKGGKLPEYFPGYPRQSGAGVIKSATAGLIIADRERKSGNLADAVEAIGKIDFADGFGLVTEEKRQELYQAAIRRLDRMMPSILESGDKKLLSSAFYTGKVLQTASSKEAVRYTPAEIDSIFRANL